MALAGRARPNEFSFLLFAHGFELLSEKSILVVN
jgi:hypothetical protein